MIEIDVINALIYKVDEGIVTRFKIIYQKIFVLFFRQFTNLHIETLQNLQSFFRLFPPGSQSELDENIKDRERAFPIWNRICQTHYVDAKFQKLYVQTHTNNCYTDI